MVLTAACLAGCGGGPTYKHRLFVSEADATKLLQTAIQASNPDDRREAIARLCQTRFIHDDTVVEGLALVAQTDDSPAVRCAAIRGLGIAGGPDAVSPLLGILASKDRRPADVRSPGGPVRAEAAKVLAGLLRSDPETRQPREQLVETASRVLRNDPSRGARIGAAAMLGYLPADASLDALIDGLEQSDFGIVYQCERSLMRLTGHTHEHSVRAWRSWRSRTERPFADAGRLDAELDAGEPNWLERTLDSTKRALSSFKPKDT